MSTGPLTRRTILCVDDEPGILEIYQELGERAGMEVLTATNVDEAMARVRESASRLVLILSDYQMPKKTGFDLRRELLGEFREVPFIIVSAHVTREMALQAVDLKVAKFVEKPCQDSELLAVIEAESMTRWEQLKEEAELLSGFVGEAEALIEEMEALILILENNPQDADAINRIFAAAHTLKGASGFFKPDTVHRFTHRYEDLLSGYKKDPASLQASGITALLKGLDVIKTLIAELKLGKVGENSLEELLTCLVVEKESAECGPRSAAAQVPGVSALGIGQRVEKKSEEVRVPTSVLNEFMEKSGELTVLRNMINKVIKGIEKDLPGNRQVALLAEFLNEMHKINGSMQERVTDLRKVPLRQVFRPLGRTLRDLCVSLKKDIGLEIEGEDLRVDHTLAESLSKCLTHMIRNAADHGVETPDQREKCGKPRRGTVKITAKQTQEEISVEVADDGKGIDPSIIRKKAIEKGFITPARVQAMSDAEVRLLIFEPGFSTASVVSDVSGRGVGTDMVKKTVTDLGGQIEIDSEIGHGTLFRLSLPIPKSVLIIESLFAEVGGESFAIPQDAIVRLFQISEEEAGEYRFHFLHGKEFFTVDGSVIPVLSLKDLFQLRESTESSKVHRLILVRSKLGEYCLRVDRIHDLENTVVKNLGKCHGHLGLFLGATYLDDGRVGLVLDVEQIAARFGIKSHRLGAAPTANPHVESKASELLVVFELDVPGLYGIPQSAIERIEEFEADQVRISGAVPVVNYRNEILPLYSLSRAMGFLSSETSQPEKFTALITRVTGSEALSKRVGWLVRRVEDLIEVTEGGEDRVLHHRAPFQGGEISYFPTIVQGKTINQIQIEEAA